MFVFNFTIRNNFVRLCILRVAQQSTKHLDKILNVDEFMKRVYTVIHSNDPYARAIVLRYGMLIWGMIFILKTSIQATRIYLVFLTYMAVERGVELSSTYLQRNLSWITIYRCLALWLFSTSKFQKSCIFQRSVGSTGSGFPLFITF